MASAGDSGALLVADVHEQLLVGEASAQGCGAVGTLLLRLRLARDGIAEAKSWVHPTALHGSLFPTVWAGFDCAAAPSRASAGMGASCQCGTLGVAKSANILLIVGAGVFVMTRELRCEIRLRRRVCGLLGKGWRDGATGGHCCKGRDAGRGSSHCLLDLAKALAIAVDILRFDRSIVPNKAEFLHHLVSRCGLFHLVLRVLY
mmetsp:Transcript_551/g.1096  ORF Transcript_551/g.1096 Transcript_551/m.1096 type:complete len:203 (+) Transcript_551:251-859(+)